MIRRVVLVLIISLATLGVGPVFANSPVSVKWKINFGAGQASQITYEEALLDRMSDAYEKQVAAILSFDVDWVGLVDRKVHTYQLQYYSTSNQSWVTYDEMSVTFDPQGTINPSKNYGDYYPINEVGAKQAWLFLPQYSGSKKWLTGTFKFRIIETGSPESQIASFDVKYVPKPAAAVIKPLKVNVSFPKTAIFGDRYSIKVSTSPKVEGTCEYFIYHLRDISIGKSKLTKGKSSLSWKAFWPNEDGRKSLKAICSAKGYSGFGGTFWSGARR
jgi:hypothetical protein